MSKVKYYTLLATLLVLLACGALAAASATDRSVTATTNLFRNASFLQSTNKPIPDYWDLHHAAAVTFKNLHDQYFISGKAASPVANTKTLVIINSEYNFYHTILVPHNFSQGFPEGTYTFSVFARSDRSNAEMLIYKAWGEPKVLAKKILSRRWERYSVTFHVNDAGPNPPQPTIYFPDRATYFIAAPQLEHGSTPSAFRPSPDDSISATPAKVSAPHGNDLEVSGKKTARRKVAPISASFEYDYYTDEKWANLDLKSSYDFGLDVAVDCPGNTASGGGKLFSADSVVDRSGSARIRVPLSAFAIGRHSCTVTPQGEAVSKRPVTVVLTRVADHPHRVRVTDRRFLEVNGAPFFMVGMEVGARDKLPDWYLEDLAAHGINTLFLSATCSSSGAYNVSLTEALLAKANSHGLKVVLGRPLMGNKDADWRQKLLAFEKLLVRLRDNPAIIAWEIVDEPAANTWKDSELLDIYHGIRRIDPYRPIFMNWAYDGVPAEIGTQPRGTLQASDFYSKDYYPFAAKDDSTFKYAEHAVRALETARIFNKIPHAWIQLYGGMDAWREPTGAELNYMVYLNLMYGGMYSYWNTKSNSSATWSGVAEINRQAQTLARELFLNPEARESGLPEFVGNFTFSVWKKGRELYLIALHNGAESEALDYDLSRLVNYRAVSVRSLFAGPESALTGNRIKELFAPYQSRVYLVTEVRRLPGSAGGGEGARTRKPGAAGAGVGRQS